MKFFPVPLCGGLLLLTALCAASDDILRDKASSGDADAAFRLGLEYYSGTENRPRNPEVAVYWLRRAADRGNIPARYNVGMCYAHGIGVEKSRIRAYREFQTAAAAGLRQAQLECAKILRTGLPEEHTADRTTPGVNAEPEKALALFRTLADAGIPEARSLWAEMILAKPEALRTQTETSDAVKELELAAQAGFMPAVRLLAECCLSGKGGVAPNPARAVELLKKAAGAGDAQAAEELSQLLEYGIGIAPDETAAFDYCKRAADAGIPRAQSHLGDFYWSGKVVQQNVQEAVRFFTRGADSGDGYGKYRLARCCMDGIGVRRDAEKGLKLLMEAAKQEEPSAQYDLAGIYSEGILLPQDETAAFYWFGRAAVHRHAASMREYGKRLLSGNGTPPDEKKGRAWLVQAARGGDSEAIRTLRQME